MANQQNLSLIQPLMSISLEDLQPMPSPTNSTSSPSSGYGTQATSPLTPNSEPGSPWTTPHWIQNTLKDESKINCCSLVDPVWKNSTLDHLSPKILPPSSSLLSPRNYSPSQVHRAIVTVDVEQISPSAPRHHPYDMQTGDIFLRKPWEIASSTRTEQLFVTDRQHHAVLILVPDGEYQGAIGSFGTEPGQLHRPTGIAYDAVHDRIVVADKDNHRIQVFCAATGRFIRTFGSRGRFQGQFSFPWGVAVSPDGKYIAVTDARNRRLQLFSSSGGYIRQVKMEAFSEERPNSKNSKTLSSYPRGIVFEKSGDCMYVTDFNQHRIYRLSLDLQRMDVIVDKCENLSRPSGIDIDSSGNLLVCDTRNHLIKVFRADGTPLGTIGRVGDDSLDQPLDISVMPAGHIAALDLNGRVRIF